ncbi:ABC transporter ATP-binding protein [Ancylobacter sp. Lp-2]|uniref:ABC transporter ATP-binding protein n=1 Tax=Ancylobacter sp. Lp-2 TaxID=2881339 RepID=UPI001E49AC4C|nr:ABC transporter ATP-binding protein [Ancylobacter sp. Lp-2]MCB4771221.1 ABC transporter ATP-binding protein [Ancylobacter sp. Lp-2]
MVQTLDASHTAPAAGPHRSDIDIRNVSKSFAVDGGTVQALTDVSLAVRPGEFVSLVGPSGCGKSTLLRLIAGLDVPDSGTVAVDGQKVTKPSLTRGIVFQDHRLLPWLSVEANILLSLNSVAGAAEEKRTRVAELIRLVGLSGFEKALPHQLSGGMSQRAAIARALAPRPRLLLLDEPLGALDSLTRGYLQEELLRLWEHEGIAMVMVTHDVEEAVFLSNRVVVMDPRPGRVRQIFDIAGARPRQRAERAFVEVKQDILDLLHLHRHAA